MNVVEGSLSLTDPRVGCVLDGSDEWEAGRFRHARGHVCWCFSCARRVANRRPHGHGHGRGRRVGLFAADMPLTLARRVARCSTQPLRPVVDPDSGDTISENVQLLTLAANPWIKWPARIVVVGLLGWLIPHFTLGIWP